MHTPDAQCISYLLTKRPLYSIHNSWCSLEATLCFSEILLPATCRRVDAFKTIGQWSLCCYIVEKSPGAKMLKKAKSFRDDVKGLLRRRSSASTHESAIVEAKHRHSKSYSLPTETPLENPALTDKVGIPSREKGVVQGLEPKWQSIDEVYFNTGPLCTSNIVFRL